MQDSFAEQLEAQSQGGAVLSSFPPECVKVVRKSSCIRQQLLFNNIQPDLCRKIQAITFQDNPADTQQSLLHSSLPN